jgi:hypothetical protein
MVSCRPTPRSRGWRRPSYYRPSRLRRTSSSGLEKLFDATAWPASREVGQSERALRWRALRALAVALVLFVAYVFVQGRLQASEMPVLKVIVEGLDILIWVALWFPLDALFFGLLSYDINSDSYKRASQMQLKIEPD